MRALRRFSSFLPVCQASSSLPSPSTQLPPPLRSSLSRPRLVLAFCLLSVSSLFLTALNRSSSLSPTTRNPPHFVLSAHSPSSSSPLPLPSYPESTTRVEESLFSSFLRRTSFFLLLCLHLFQPWVACLCSLLLVYYTLGAVCGVFSFFFSAFDLLSAHGKSFVPLASLPSSPSARPLGHESSERQEESPQKSLVDTTIKKGTTDLPSDFYKHSSFFLTSPRSLPLNLLLTFLGSFLFFSGRCFHKLLFLQSGSEQRRPTASSSSSSSSSLHVLLSFFFSFLMTPVSKRLFRHFYATGLLLTSLALFSLLLPLFSFLPLLPPRHSTRLRPSSSSSPSLSSLSSSSSSSWSTCGSCASSSPSLLPSSPPPFLLQEMVFSCFLTFHALHEEGKTTDLVHERLPRKKKGQRKLEGEDEEAEEEVSGQEYAVEEEEGEMKGEKKRWVSLPRGIFFPPAGSSSLRARQSRRFGRVQGRRGRRLEEEKVEEDRARQTHVAQGEIEGGGGGGGGGKKDEKKKKKSQMRGELEKEEEEGEVDATQRRQIPFGVEFPSSKDVCHSWLAELFKVLLALSCFCLHLFRRLLEEAFLVRKSPGGSRMSFAAYLVGISFYIATPFSLLLGIFSRSSSCFSSSSSSASFGPSEPPCTSVLLLSPSMLSSLARPPVDLGAGTREERPLPSPESFPPFSPPDLTSVLFPSRGADLFLLLLSSFLFLGGSLLQFHSHLLLARLRPRISTEKGKVENDGKCSCRLFSLRSPPSSELEIPSPKRLPLASQTKERRDPGASTLGLSAQGHGEKKNGRGCGGAVVSSVAEEVPSSLEARERLPSCAPPPGSASIREIASRAEEKAHVGDYEGRKRGREIILLDERFSTTSSNSDRHNVKDGKNATRDGGEREKVKGGRIFSSHARATIARITTAYTRAKRLPSRRAAKPDDEDLKTSCIPPKPASSYPLVGLFEAVEKKEAAAYFDSPDEEEMCRREREKEGDDNSESITGRRRTGFLDDIRRGNCKRMDYRIPHGGFFSYVSCPHYLAEILLYVHLTILVPTYPMLGCLLFVSVTMVVNASKTHAWYQKTFGTAYPRERRCLIPFLF